MNFVKVVQKLNLIFLFGFFMITTSAYGLSDDDLRVDQETLIENGFKPSQEMYSVSIQAVSLYKAMQEKTYEGLVPTPDAQFYISGEKENSKFTAYYYRYKSREDATKSASFIKGLIWGETGRPTKMHPERIISLNNYIIIISSKSPGLFSELLLRKVLLTTPPPELIRVFQERLNCSERKSFELCEALTLFSQEETLPAKAGGPWLGITWEVDEQGKVTKRAIDVFEIRAEESAFKGYWFSIKPSNPDEEKELNEIISSHSQGQKVDLSEGLLSFLNGAYHKVAEPVVSNKKGRLFLFQSKAAMYIKRVTRGYVVIVTTEHLTGESMPFLIAFYPELK